MEMRLEQRFEREDERKIPLEGTLKDAFHVEFENSRYHEKKSLNEILESLPFEVRYRIDNQSLLGVEKSQEKIEKELKAIAIAAGRLFDRYSILDKNGEPFDVELGHIYLGTHIAGERHTLVTPYRRSDRIVQITPKRLPSYQENTRNIAPQTLFYSQTANSLTMKILPVEDDGAIQEKIISNITPHGYIISPMHAEAYHFVFKRPKEFISPVKVRLPDGSSNKSKPE